jgi:drug/metabolite transporter (DMT)-like permease
MSSTKAAFIFTLMPFFTALFSYFFNKERLSYQKSTGLLIGFLGMMPTLFTTTSLEELSGGLAFFSLAEFATLGSVASFAYNLIALQRLVKHRGCPAVLANGVSMLIGGFLSLNAALLFESQWIIGNPWYFLLYLCALLLISNFMGLNLQAMLLKKHSATFMAFAGFLTPLFTAFFGWLFLHETIRLPYLISFALVIIGLTMFHYDEFRKKKDIPRAEVPDASEF